MKRCRRERERYTQLNAEFQRTKRDKRPYANNAKKQRKPRDWKRLEISSRKLEISREHFMQG